MVSTAAKVQSELRAVAVVDDAEPLGRFFKTGPGQYGEGDVFIGVRAPATRKIAAIHAALSLPEITKLLASEVHEDRAAALAILVAQFKSASSGKGRNEEMRAALSDFYVGSVRSGRVNNWDLVDMSAEYLLGEYLYDRDRALLFEFAQSPSLWARRVSIISTFGFIKHGDSSTTFEIATLLLDDREDLIHKAVGWMLREVGKRISRTQLVEFLNENAARMPRTALSYATEHLDPDERVRLRSMPRTFR